MSAPHFKIDRRVAMRWVLTAAASASMWGGRRSARAGIAVTQPVAQGYGVDPDLLNPVTPWDRIMTPHQLQLTASLADLILPGTADAPAPSVLGIAEFVDEWVSAPYPDQRDDREIVLSGLAWLEEDSERRGHGFLQLPQAEQIAILSAMAAADAADTPAVFLRRFRFLVVGAYYTTPAGFRDIGYIGNVARSSYPPPTEAETAYLDDQLRKLGLPV